METTSARDLGETKCREVPQDATFESSLSTNNAQSPAQSSFTSLPMSIHTLTPPEINQPLATDVDANSCAFMAIWIVKNSSAAPPRRTVRCLSLILDLSEATIYRWFAMVKSEGLNRAPSPRNGSNWALTLDHLTTSACHTWLVKNVYEMPDDFMLMCLAFVFDSSIDILRTWFTQNTPWNLTPQDFEYQLAPTTSDSDQDALNLPRCTIGQATLFQWTALINELISDVQKFYTCTFGCGARFAKKGSWTRHERESRSHKVYSCSISGCPNPIPLRRFRRRHRFKDHLLRYHPLTPLDDQQISESQETFSISIPMVCLFENCGVTFESWSERITHYDSHFEMLKISRLDPCEIDRTKHSRDDDSQDDNDGENDQPGGAYKRARSSHQPHSCQTAQSRQALGSGLPSYTNSRTASHVDTECKGGGCGNNGMDELLRSLGRIELDLSSGGSEDEAESPKLSPLNLRTSSSTPVVISREYQSTRQNPVDNEYDSSIAEEGHEHSSDDGSGFSLVSYTFNENRFKDCLTSLAGSTLAPRTASLLSEAEHKLLNPPSSPLDPTFSDHNKMPANHSEECELSDGREKHVTKCSASRPAREESDAVILHAKTNRLAPQGMGAQFE